VNLEVGQEAVAKRTSLSLAGIEPGSFSPESFCGLSSPDRASMLLACYMDVTVLRTLSRQCYCSDSAPITQCLLYAAVIWHSVC
jgi:hypothetical protein